VKVASVLFSNSQNRYDYLCPFDVKPGDEVIVDTRRGEAKVIVAEIKDHSDRATAQIKRLADPEPTLDRGRPF
jgi:hypothetical protein